MWVDLDGSEMRKCMIVCEKRENVKAVSMRIYIYTKKESMQTDFCAGFFFLFQHFVKQP